MKTNTRKRDLVNSKSVTLAGILLSVTLLHSATAAAEVRDQAKRMYDRIAGVPPSEQDLTAMTNLLGGSDPNQVPSEDQFIQVAMLYPMANKNFYNVTLKNWITPWTNEEQTVFADLNDFTATAIGMIRDNLDFRGVLSEDIIYAAPTQVTVDGIDYNFPAYSNSNNDHYEQLEDSGAPLNEVLVRRTQSEVTGLPSDAAAGVMTTRAAAKAFFVAGTNRAMLRFTMMNFLCNDMEQFRDTSRPSDRIRQDVTRSPGGDSRIFLNTCVSCHSGMDPLAQAFAYYNWDGVEGENGGRLEYTPGTVQPKYHINGGNFKWGYVTPNDQWVNYWRKGPNATWVGWKNLTGAGYQTEEDGPYAYGSGASSLGEELANTRLFAQCQARKVFKNVCLRDPGNNEDHNVIDAMMADFNISGGSIKRLFGKAAYYCRGE